MVMEMPQADGYRLTAYRFYSVVVKVGWLGYDRLAVQPKDIRRIRVARIYVNYPNPSFRAV